MSGHGGDEAAVSLEENVTAREKGARTAGTAEDAIERADDHRRRWIDIELCPPRRVRDSHHQSGRHPETRSIAEQNSQPAIVERNKVINVAADRIRDSVVGRDLVLARQRRRLWDQVS